MRRPITITIALIWLTAALTGAAAQEWGVSVGSWSFAGGGPGAGAYACAGLSTGLGQRLELEAFGVARATPAPFGDALAGAILGFSVFGPRRTTYFNMALDLGFLQTVVEGGTPGLGPSYAMLRLSPLVVGTPYYGHRDRIFSLGLVYDLGSGALSATWNVLIVHWYPGSHAWLPAGDRER